MPQIRAQGPKINFSVAKLPQIEGNQQIINFANYWVETVSLKSKHKNEAWDFIQFATRAENVKSYLEKTKKPTALRSLIESQLEDIDIGVFTDQVLTAKSWYRGADAIAAEKVLGEMINDVVSGKEEINNAIDIGAQRVQQTINK
jgi:maltose-binding protein MalE